MEQEPKSVPSAAEMQDYINSLNGKIKTGPLEGSGWFVTMVSNEHGSNNPTITLSKKDEVGGEIIDKTISWQEFKSWQE